MKDLLSKQFWNHVLPSMIAFAFTGIYSIVDGIFVGLKVSDVGLAAINIAYPIQALILAVGTGIGMAGAINIAIYKGMNDEKKALHICGNTMVYLILAGILCTLLLWPIHDQLLTWMGASGQVHKYASDYLNIMLLGAFFQLLACGIVPIIRNYDGSISAMNSMILGFASNIVLDWLLVFRWNYGTSGAALATTIAQFLSLIPCLFFFIKRKAFFKQLQFRLDRQIFVKMAKAFFSPFALSLSPNIIIAMLNIATLQYGGDEAVACYAVISYVICVIQLLLQGIGDGVQPLIGRYYGAKDDFALHYLQNKAYIFSLCIAIGNFVVLYPFRHSMPLWFGASASTAEMFADAIHYFFIGQLFVSYVRISISYFYAIDQNLSASILIYGEIVLQAILLFVVLPMRGGIEGVWQSVMITQLILLIMAYFLMKKSSKRKISLNTEPSLS